MYRVWLNRYIDNIINISKMNIGDFNCNKFVNKYYKCLIICFFYMMYGVVFYKNRVLNVFYDV